MATAKKVAVKKTATKVATEVVTKVAAEATAKVAVKTTVKTTVKPVVKVATKPAPKVAAKPAPKVAAKVAVKPAAKPAPKVAAKPVVKVAVKAAPKVAAKPAAKVAVKPAPKPVARTSPKFAIRTFGVGIKAAVGVKKGSFKTGDKVVYPAHGVGVITAIKKERMDEQTVHFFVIRFERDRLTLHLPVDRVGEAGLRNTTVNLDSVLQTLKKPRRVRRTMWSRRAQEYESKINSGNPVHIAEVVRDLYRKPEQNEQSYSERQIYQEALERLACEFAAVKGIAQPAATEELEGILLTA